MIIIGFILIVLGGILIYWHIPYSPFKSGYDQSMKQRAENVVKTTSICTNAEIAALPKPLQRYCKYIGLENFPKYQVVRIDFQKTKFVFDAQSGKELNMDYDLWLFYDKPYRSAYCKSSMFGIPFDGIDYCTENQLGGVKGILGKAIPIFNVCDEQGYKAELISWIAELVLVNPSALLSSYVTYEQIDDVHVKATIDYQGASGAGIFTFNQEGAITEFFSDERQVEKVNGVPTAVGWRCEYEDYEQMETLKVAKKVRCVKVFSDKVVVYFASDDFVVQYIK